MFRNKRSAASPHYGNDEARLLELTHQLRATSYRLLENRMVFDGAIADTTAEIDAASDTPTQTDTASNNSTNLVNVLENLAAAPAGPAPAGATIVFIDSRVQDASVLAAAVPDGAEIVMLDVNRDGVEQISEVLSTRQNIDAVHIVSHGLEGELHLGNATLDVDSMSGEHHSELITIGNALSVNADILIYGCNFAAGSAGSSAVSALASITGADIAASTDDTGSADLGGDWDLETRVGLIDAELIDAPEWNGKLAPLVISAAGQPITSGGTGVGATGLWVNAGTVGSTSIDVRATVSSATTGATVDFDTVGDDMRLLITNGEVTVRWEIFASGTGQTIVATGDPNFQIADIDGDASQNLPFPQVEIEAVSPNLVGLTSYTTETATNLDVGINGNNLLVRGTVNQNSESTSLVAFDWTNVSAWDVTYTAVVGESTRWFFHDGDGDFTFTDPDTTYLLGIDLDDNNSTATGTAYKGIFLEGGSAVPVVDGDVTVIQSAVLGNDLGSANVVLTNAQPGDQLLVGGSAAATGTINGLSYTIANSGGQITVSLSGTASISTYETTLKAITFENANSSPDLTDRSLNVSVSNTNFITTSNIATTTIEINAIPDTQDPDPTPGTPFFDGNNLNVPAVDNVAVSIDLDTYYTDLNGDPLTFTPNLTGLPSWLTYDSVNHILSGTPPVDNAGDVAVPLTVSDGRGGILNTTVTFQPVNPGPDAKDDTVSTGFQTAVTVDLAGNDTDPDGDPLTIVGTPTLVNPAHGILAFVSGTGWVFTPATGFSGDAVINYTIQDQDGATDSATHTVTVANAPPEPDDPDPTSGTPFFDGNNLKVPAVDNVAVAIDLDSYFIDPNGDPLTFTPNLVGLPSWVTYDSVNHVLSGTPPVDNAGDVAVPLTVSDDRGGILNTTVTFQPVNPGPDAKDDTASTGFQTSVTVDLDSNDTDPDGDPLTILGTPTLVNPAHGVLTFVSGTGWVFTPATGFSGDAVINYTIQDQDGATDSATHTVTVAKAPPEPHIPQPTPIPPTAPTPQSAPPTITVDGFVLDAVKQIGSLNGVSGSIGVRGIVVDTVGHVGSLEGVIGTYDSLQVSDVAVPLPQGRVTEFWNVTQPVHAPSSGSTASATTPEGLAGFSLRWFARDHAPDNEAPFALVETLVRKDELMILLSQSINASPDHIKEYRVTGLGDAKIPAWLNDTGEGLLMGKRPADVDSVSLRIFIDYADGKHEHKDIKINPVTGEVKPLRPSSSAS